MKRGYSNDKIYRIIGGVRCERLPEGAGFKCWSGLKPPAQGPVHD